jgi:hypothetical protein
MSFTYRGNFEGVNVNQGTDKMLWRSRVYIGKVKVRELGPLVFDLYDTPL